MRVRIDEAGEHSDVAKVDLTRLRVRWRAAGDGAVGAIRHDAAAVRDNPAVGDRRLRDRKDPGGVIPNQCWRVGLEGLEGLEITRSSLPDRLRAG